LAASIALKTDGTYYRRGTYPELLNQEEADEVYHDCASCRIRSYVVVRTCTNVWWHCRWKLESGRSRGNGSSACQRHERKHHGHGDAQAQKAQKTQKPSSHVKEKPRALRGFSLLGKGDHVGKVKLLGSFASVIAM
jgi:hypothetical protein